MFVKISLTLIPLTYFIGCGTTFSSGGTGGNNTGGSNTVAPATTGAPVGPTTPTTTPQPITVTAAPPQGACQGRQLGIYTWNQLSWMTADSPIISFLQSPTAHQWTCGDVWINVADYSNPAKINHTEVLVPFIKNVRLSGNTGVIYLTYGDVVMKNGTAAKVFVDTFFNWLSNVSVSDAQAMAPIGLSYDVEHIDPQAIQAALQYAQQKKAEIIGSLFGGNGEQLLIQWTIEGEPLPTDTDYIMRYADRALMMLYRNYITSNIDPTGVDNIIERLRFMFTQQCTQCLNDAYAIANYKAKITIMVEASCRMGASCGKVSFCAYDGGAPGWGISDPVQYLWNTLQTLDSGMISKGVLNAQQKARLFATGTSAYAVHNWEWFTCFFGVPSLASSYCSSYHQEAAGCRTE